MAANEHDLAAEMELARALGMQNDLDRQHVFDPSRAPPRGACRQLVDDIGSLFGMPVLPIFGGCTLHECGSGSVSQSLSPGRDAYYGLCGDYYGLWGSGTRLGPLR